MRPFACVLGDMDLVRPLGRAGIPVAPVGPPGSATRASRFARAAIDAVDPWTRAPEQVELLLRFARAQPVAPVLFYEADATLRLVSEHRDRLAEAFRFVLAERDLVASLLDKARFAALAERLGLPVPRAVAVAAGGDAPDGLRFPLVAKPLTRHTERWAAVSDGRAKAVRIDGPERLRAVLDRLAGLEMDAILQELVEGDETRIESYHAYVDAGGATAGEFTGRKVRTSPPAFGHSSALVTTDRADVAALGRSVLERLGLRGVAKLDFKRAPDGTLHLLEVNPRFNLWHHLGAVAGVDLPAMVFADLTGEPRPPVRRVRPGVRWVAPWDDLRSARAGGVPLRAWAGFALRAEARSVVALDDPMPFLRARVLPRLRQALPTR